MLGGRDLRADFKATSLDNLHHMYQKMVHQSFLPGAQEVRATWTGVEPKEEHRKYKTVGDSITSASQAPEDSSFEMSTDWLCICPDFNPSLKFGDITGPNHQTFVGLNHSASGHATADIVSTDSQQDPEMPDCFKETFEAILQGQINFSPAEGDNTLEGMGLAP
ncbi:hypothetical protein CSUB01_00426 [Colletotrichum sublineola]|uniref:Uncharacterized protein n=1 Tax=Colletotrichum sublineola TaxID=1173701 RepID=A0A066X9W1_COLSU|nr:hypothetical protein CSUB01_00426 [Colletotrichum sublineola]